MHTSFVEFLKPLAASHLPTAKDENRSAPMSPQSSAMDQVTQVTYFSCTILRFPGHWFPKNDMHHMTAMVFEDVFGSLKVHQPWSIMEPWSARRLRLSPRWSWRTPTEIVLPSALEAMDGEIWLRRSSMFRCQFV